MRRSVRDYLKPRPCPIDNRPFPNFTTGPDGKLMKLYPDGPLTRDWEKWQSEACQHERKGIANTPAYTGMPMFSWRCKDCGFRLSEFIPYALAADLSEGEVPKDEVDQHYEDYKSRRKAEIDEIISRAVARQA